MIWLRSSREIWVGRWCSENILFQSPVVGRATWGFVRVLFKWKFCASKLQPLMCVKLWWLHVMGLIFACHKFMKVCEMSASILALWRLTYRCPEKMVRSDGAYCCNLLGFPRKTWLFYIILSKYPLRWSRNVVEAIFFFLCQSLPI